MGGGGEGRGERRRGEEERGGSKAEAGFYARMLSKYWMSPAIYTTVE